MPSISERATPRRRTREEKQPDYTVRARNGRGWMQVGAAWKPDRDGNVVLSLKLNTVPVGFDGVLKVLLPLAEDETDTQDE
jgi:uncharacterized protein (DUF736 family)